MKSQINLNTQVTLSPDALARIIDDEAVILSLAKNSYFGLDPIGTEIWQMMASGKNLSQVLDAVLGKYEVPEHEARNHLLELVDQLERQGLVKTK